MTLLDAKQYDETASKRRRNLIAGIVVAVLLAGYFAWEFRNYPEERIADHFFAALEKQQYETAYGIWMHDPEWRQHPQNYKQYPYNEFYTDWGPGGEWGLIKSYKIYASGTPPGGGSGVVVEVEVNQRAEHARVWVQKSDKTMTFSPY
jgi:hypothetical protein